MCNNWNFKINFDSRKPKRNSTPARSCIRTLCGLHVGSLSKALCSNLLLLTQVYKMGTGLGWEGNSWRPSHKQHYKLSNLAQSLVKKRWAPLDALKSVPTQFTFFFTIQQIRFIVYIPMISALNYRLFTLPVHRFSTNSTTVPNSKSTSHHNFFFLIQICRDNINTFLQTISSSFKSTIAAQDKIAKTNFELIITL